MNKNNSKKKDIKALNFFGNALEYFDRYSSNLSLEQNTNSDENHQTSHPNFLRDQMLIELNKLKELILNHPNVKLNNLSEEEKQEFFKFVNYYSICPICGNTNHYNILKELYFDDKKQILKEQLIQFINLKNQNLLKLNINFGIPCCECFKLNYEKKTTAKDPSSEVILF